MLVFWLNIIAPRRLGILARALNPRVGSTNYGLAGFRWGRIRSVTALGDGCWEGPVVFILPHELLSYLFSALAHAQSLAMPSTASTPTSGSSFHKSALEPCSRWSTWVGSEVREPSWTDTPKQLPKRLYIQRVDDKYPEPPSTTSTLILIPLLQANLMKLTEPS